MGAGWWDGPLASMWNPSLPFCFLSTFPDWLMSLVSRFGLCCLAREQKELGRELFGCVFEKAFSVVHLLYLPAQGNSTTCFVYTTICLSELFVHLQLFDKWEKSLIRCLLFSRPFCQQDKNAPVAKFPREPMTWHRSRHAVKWDLGYGMHQHAKVKVQGSNTLLAY